MRIVNLRIMLLDICKLHGDVIRDFRTREKEGEKGRDRGEGKTGERGR